MSQYIRYPASGPSLPLSIANGGTGLSAGGTANQLLGMDSAGVALEYKTLNGTVSQITVSNPSAGNMTLSLPQNIATTSTPTFGGLNLADSSTIQFAGNANNKIQEVTSNRLRITGSGEVDIFVGSEATYSIAIDANDAFFRKPIAMVNSPINPINIIWNSDGTGGLGNSKTANRPDFVHVKSEISLGGVQNDTTLWTSTTTGAGAQTVVTYAIPTNTSVMLTASVQARRTGGAAGSAGDTAGYSFVSIAKNVAGTVTINVISANAFEDQAAWDAAFAVSGTNVQLNVTGATNNNINWQGCTLTEQV